MTYSRKAKQQVQANLNLDSLPDDDFMRLVEEADIAAAVPRPVDRSVRATSPAELEVTVQQPTAGRLLALAKAAAGRSLSDIGATLGVSRQRVSEILDSENLELQTVVRVAAACGYEMRLSLHPIDTSGPDLTAVLPSAGYGLRD